MIKPLEYYFAKKGIIEHVIFNKYTINEFGVVRNKNSGKDIAHQKIRDYNVIMLYDDFGKTHSIHVGRAIASTFLGPPPTPNHTADHINNKRPDYDALANIRWLDKSGQCRNQDRPKTYKSAFLVERYGEEKTFEEWVEYLKGEKNPFGREYTSNMINHYAQRKQYGFAYKTYHDLPGEVWKEIIDSKNKTGRWEISNMNRVKYATKHAENVLSDERLGLKNEYPVITINRKTLYCHILSFMTFFPEEYADKKPDEMVLHEDDDKTDFRPHKLRLGTSSENGKDAHKNGKYKNKKSEKIKCASYIDSVFEKDHVSQGDAVRYLKSKGYTKASEGNIGMALSGAYKTAYGRTWEKI